MTKRCRSLFTLNCAQEKTQATTIPAAQFVWSGCVKAGLVKVAPASPTDPTIGRGLVATESISAGTRVASYGGDVIRLAEGARPTSAYVMLVDAEERLYIDGSPVLRSTRGHFANMVNDARGLGVEPNCEFEVFRAPDGRYGALLVTTQRIERNEELLTSYGHKYWASSDAEPEQIQVRRSAGEQEDE